MKGLITDKYEVDVTKYSIQGNPTAIGLREDFSKLFLVSNDATGSDAKRYVFDYSIEPEDLSIPLNPLHVQSKDPSVRELSLQRPDFLGNSDLIIVEQARKIQKYSYGNTESNL